MSLVEEIGTGLDGLEQLRALISPGRKPGMPRTLDFEFAEVEAGRAVFAGTPGEHAYNPIGTAHGGYAATLLDSACGCAVHSQLTATQAYTTLDLNVSYHRPITRDTGYLRAEGGFAHWASEWPSPRRDLPMLKANSMRRLPRRC